MEAKPLAMAMQWVTRGLLRAAIDSWDQHQQTGKGVARTAFDTGAVVVPLHGNMGQFNELNGQRGIIARVKALAAVRADALDAIKPLNAMVRSGDMRVARWAEGVTQQSDLALLRAAQLGSGRADPWNHDATARAIDALRASRDGELSRLLEKHAADECTVPQLTAWTDTTVRGSTQAAYNAGGLGHYGDKPVRWIMGAVEDHCRECPRWARTYPDVAAMLRVTGGWPGRSRSSCHGNCHCHIEAAAARSVMADTSKLLVARKRAA